MEVLEDAIRFFLLHLDWWTGLSPLVLERLLVVASRFLGFSRRLSRKDSAFDNPMFRSFLRRKCQDAKWRMMIGFSLKFKERGRVGISSLASAHDSAFRQPSKNASFLVDSALSPF